ncbi:hypothetical protein B5E56_07475 [Flavonifractor sp. An112]|uniref:DUF5044 domain-containing protein n=1 Tax=Flavonifractor sp. An112 TaxID=1965544 RepID=UPI000B3654F1|nr:DUF5044 domain-containing protein [Flavonifractor sp. An112]OUQ60265.1 hypothetical protein B5E56_07475 [Flavonifractor sp. An112]
MARPSVTPAQRKRRILRDALLLAVVLVVLVLRLDFPILTAEQALEATQDRYFFGPGEVITTLDYSREANKVKIGQYDRYYILRHGDWYAWCGVNHYGLFWQTGGLDAVENDPDLPLVPLVVSDWNSGAVLVISNDPEITQVEITFPISAETKQGYTLLSASQTESTENCFLIPYTSGPGFVFPEDLQVKGYDAAGALLYQSPKPESWATRYELR